MGRIEVEPLIKGEWWDEYWEQRSDGELYLAKTTAVLRNTKMDQALVAIAALLANQASFDGFLYHAQGRGNAGWGSSPPAVNTADTTLYDEIYRATPDSIIYLNSVGIPVSGPTNIIQVKTTYGLAAMAGETIREQAVFAGTATVTPNSGYIFNVIRHAPIAKTGAVQLVRYIKFTFS